ncbi:MAG: FAD-binding protein [Coriobacteriia bacterium]|nr:FAD-binding protein [Coriobacteriia bacterium]
MLENKEASGTGLSRRSFLAGAGLLAVSVAGAGIAGCSAKPEGAQVAHAGTSAKKRADRTVETDVLVVGLGASGLLAAYGAAAKGAKVIAIDTAENMSGTTNVRTSGAWAVGSELQKKDPRPFGIRDAMNHVNEKTNYVANQKAMRAILGAGGRAIDALSSAGMKWRMEYEAGLFGDPATAELTVRGIHWYGFKGDERAAVFQKLADMAGVECMFSTTAESALLEDGKLVGVRCSSKRETVDILAKATVMAAGGFLSNPEMVAEYFAGGDIVNMGSQNSTGAGIRLAIEAGAQTGMNFSVSGGEYGGANKQATPTFAFRPNTGTNDAMRLPVFGGLLVDAEGRRFIDEGFANERAMFAGESLIRERFYYAVADRSFIERLATEPVSNFYGDERMKGMFAGIVLSEIEKHFDEAIKQGWAFKADTIEALAAKFGQDPTKFAETIAQYNEYCAKGEDKFFFKDKKFLQPLSRAPYYIVQSQASGWVSLGGIKTNASLQALGSDGQPVPSLFVAGADADIFTTPLYLTASENGFSLASGLVAGEAAADSV